MRPVLWGLIIFIAISAIWVMFRTIGAVLEVGLTAVIAGIVCGVIVLKFAPLTKRRTNRRKSKPRLKALWKK
jgi:hypothetical protein